MENPETRSRTELNTWGKMSGRISGGGYPAKGGTGLKMRNQKLNKKNNLEKNVEYKTFANRKVRIRNQSIGLAIEKRGWIQKHKRSQRRATTARDRSPASTSRGLSCVVSRRLKSSRWRTHPRATISPHAGNTHTYT